MPRSEGRRGSFGFVFVDENLKSPESEWTNAHLGRAHRMAASFAVAMPAVVVSARVSAAGATPHRVFVYGTLKKGFHNHRVLQESEGRFVAAVKTKLPHRLVLGEDGIPYLMRRTVPVTPGDTKGTELTQVTGELWEVDHEGLASLDLLEGVAVGMYERIEMKVVFENSDDEETAFGYIAGPESVKRGIGEATCPVIRAYDLDLQEKNYVQKQNRAKGSLGASMNW